MTTTDRNIIRLEKSAVPDAEILHNHSGTWGDEDIVLIAGPLFLQKYDDNKLLELLQSADVVHSGLELGGANAFESLKICAFNWLFLNPSPDRESISWKATTDFVVFSVSLFREMGGFDKAYQSLHSALMDFCYRVLVSGGKSLHLPQNTGSGHVNTENNDVSKLDVCRFAYKHLGTQPGHFFRLYSFLTQGRVLRQPGDLVPLPVMQSGRYPFRLRNPGSPDRINAYSAIIPTIDRYEYIARSLDSLLALSFPPSEIIVIDQTDSSSRRPDVYQPYIEQGILKVFYLEQAGQCTARTTGLEAAVNDWVLLFEDDAEAWPDMVEEHIALINRTNCDVSTGVVVPPGADETFIPERNCRYAVSDIFTTGNAFLRKSTIWEVGGFDPVFDRGPGADDDLGRRLYLNGKLIIYNYKSIEVHHKAPRGGMRVHGAWWRMSSTTWGPFPPPTQLHVINQYYPGKLKLFLLLNMLIRARKKHSLPAYLWLVFTFPFKYMKAVMELKRIKN